MHVPCVAWCKQASTLCRAVLPSRRPHQLLQELLLAASRPAWLRMQINCKSMNL